MKRILILCVICAMLLAMGGCAQPQESPDSPEVPEETEGTVLPTDPSGRYELDADRLEAIVNDGGAVTVPNGGNARVYYQIFVGSFSDSNGDGTGDLRGIINRFDYLNDGDDNSGLSLGVEGIWLSPIFVSPSYHKYDVADYYQIDPKFGTEDDLKELIELCHSRNVQIILDLVINHTATTHPWFQEFLASRRSGDTANPYYDFYSCTDKPENATFSPISGTSMHYECNFSGDMPELNFDNEAVRQAMVDAAKYYLDLGVDGFRFDAAKYIYFGNEEKNAEFWLWYMEQLRAIKPDIYTVAEVWDTDLVTINYTAATNCFNFSLSQGQGMIAKAAKGGNVNGYMNYVDGYLAAIHEKNPEAMMIGFIANHDMDRSSGYLAPNNGQAQMGANINLLMPGSSFIYYGEEIGIKGSRGSSHTDANRRLAMLWGDGDTVTDPVGADYSAGQVNGTVADQLGDGSSLYNHYKKVIAIRKANPEIAYGTFTPLSIPDTKAGGYLASYEGSTVAVIHNSTTEAVQIDLAAVTDVPLTTIAAFVGMADAALEGTVLTIGAQTSVVLK